MNFTDDVKLGTRKYSSRGISSLAKFTSANGNVYGTLALDTRRATDDDTQEQPAVIKMCADVLKDTWVLMYNLLTSTNCLLTNGLRL